MVGVFHWIVFLNLLKSGQVMVHQFRVWCSRNNRPAFPASPDGIYRYSLFKLVAEYDVLMILCTTSRRQVDIISFRVSKDQGTKEVGEGRVGVLANTQRIFGGLVPEGDGGPIGRSGVVVVEGQTRGCGGSSGGGGGGCRGRSGGVVVVVVDGKGEEKMRR